MGRLPDFLVIGAFKSGTTSLVDYLGQHPKIFMPWLQEPNYFAFAQDSESTSPTPEIEWHGRYRRPRARTLTQYEGLFADAPADCVVGECSPAYLRSPHAAARIAKTMPDARLLAVLRNPVERAYSDYQAFVRDSLEHDDFETAIARDHSAKAGHQYVMTGFYGAQVQLYVTAFSRGRLKVVLSEDLRADRRAVLDDVCGWLGVPSEGWDPDLTTDKNVSGRPRNRGVALAYRARRRLRPWLKPIVPSWAQRRADRSLAAGLVREDVPLAARHSLVEIYRDDVALLESLIERDLSSWLRVEPDSV